MTRTRRTPALTASMGARPSVKGEYLVVTDVFILSSVVFLISGLSLVKSHLEKGFIVAFIIHGIIHIIKRAARNNWFNSIQDI